MSFIVTCAAALAGIALADLRPVAGLPLLCAGVAAALGLVCARSSATRTIALIALAFSLGAARVELLPSVPTPTVGVLRDLSATARDDIAANLPEPQASLAAGVLLGGSGQLDAPFRADLRRSGLSHLLAIDGFKQVVLAGGVAWASSRLVGVGKPIAGLVSVLTVVAYTLLTGAHASAMRAALMLGLASLAGLSGRIADPLSNVLAASLLMAMLDPGVLLDVGMQLSVSATLGLILLWPRLRRVPAIRKLPRWVGEPIGLSAAVTLACLPVTLATLEQVSLVSPLAHVVAVPLLPFVLLGAALLALVAGLPAPLPAFAAWIAWAPTSLLTVVIRLFGEMPGAAMTTGRLPVAGTVALACLLLAVGLWRLPELAEAREALSIWVLRHASIAVPLAACAACGIVAACLHLLQPDGRVHVEPLVVGSGDAVFVRGATGRTTLIVQGRPDGRALSDAVGDHLAVWEHKLDEVVLVDAPAERAVTLTLQRYPADAVLRSSSAGATSALTTSAARPGSAD